MPELIIYRVEDVILCPKCGLRITIEPVLKEGVNPIECPGCHTQALYYHISTEEEIREAFKIMGEHLNRRP